MNKILLSVRGLTKRWGSGCEYCTGERTDREDFEKNYCRRCGTVWALDKISFDVWNDEVLGIVGESGSGKSTLLRCLNFDIDASEGDVRLEGWENADVNVLNLSGQKKRQIRNRFLGMVYQNPLHGLRMKLSALSNVAEKLIAAGERRVSAMEERSNELLTTVAIPATRRHEPPTRFSGGMQQRVQIAKAMSNRPPLLFLDEVTTGLDLSVQAKVLDLVLTLKQELSGMILVSHDLGVIRMLADRTLVMLDGRVVESGLTDQILEDPQHAYTQELVHSLLT